MATVYKLLGPGGHSLQIALAGERVITGEGEDRVVQEFPSAAAAAEHLERTLRLHRRAGYGLVAAEEVEDAVALAAPDPLGERAEWEPRRRRLQVVFDDPEGVAARCAAVAARVRDAGVRTLHLVCDPASPGEALADAAVGRPLAGLEALIFDTHFQTVTRQAENSIGDLGELLAALPDLRRLFATGDLILSPCRHERLRELYLLGDPLDEAALEGLGASSLPALEVLGIGLASDAGPVDGGAALRALRSLRAPRLRAIEIDGVADLAGWIAALADAPLPGSWSSLVVSGSAGDEDALVAALTAAAPQLGGLEVLGLPLADELSTEAEAALRRLLPNLRDRDEVSQGLLPGVYSEW